SWAIRHIDGSIASHELGREVSVSIVHEQRNWVFTKSGLRSPLTELGAVDTGQQAPRTWERCGESLMGHGGRLTPQFSGRALPYVTWHFIHHGPLQLLVRRRHGTGTWVTE